MLLERLSRYSEYMKTQEPGRDEIVYRVKMNIDMVGWGQRKQI